LSWSEEDKLILSILKQKDGANFSLEEVEPDAFTGLAREEGLSGLLYKILKENGLIQKFPAPVQKSLRDSYLLSLTNNIVLINDLSRVLLSLEEKGVRTIVHKGSALLERVYADIGVRPVMDIDLLICEERDDDKVNGIMESIGYRLTSTCPRIYNNGRTIIDIHTDIDSFSRLGRIPHTPELDNNSLWESGSPWGASFDSVRILSPEDTVLTLSIHLVKHSFLRLLWLIDIIEVIKGNPGIDWKKTGQRARESGFDKLLFYVLSYINKISRVIPEDLLSEIRPERLGLIEKKIMDRIINNQRRDGYGDILYFYTIKGTFKRIIFASRILFPAQDKIKEMSGSRYPFIYYLKRIAELFKMVAKYLWNYVAGGRSMTREQSEVKGLRGERL
jgi:hypothetical protein